MSTQQAVFTLAKAADLLAYIGTIGRNGKVLDRMIQIAAVHAIGHTIEFGDIRFANELYGAMPQGARRQAMVKYLEKHGPFAYIQSAKRFAFDKRSRTWTFDGPALMKMPWYEIETEKVVTTLDVARQVDALIKRIEAAIEKDAGNVHHADLLEDIKETALQYHARQYVDDSSFDWAVPPAAESDDAPQP